MEVRVDRVDPLDGRELLAHRNFVRSLARELVRDAATADDVTQEAMARLLEVKRPGSIRPWLRTVARNLARRFGRRERRRAEVEGGRAPAFASGESTAAPATDELAARLELQRRLTERVLALEPRARDVVILHFYEGKTVAEVAEQLAIPLETARTRLRRALAELRAGWNGELGGEREGLAALAMLARWAPAKGLVAAAGATAASPFLWSGVAAMTTKVKVMIAAIVVTVAAGAIAFWPSRAVVSDPKRPPPPAAQSLIPDPASAAVVPAKAGEPEPVAATRHEAEAPATAPIGSLLLHVHFARDHAPAAGVTMSVACAGREYHDVHRARTDAAGDVRFTSLPAGRVRVSSDRCDLGERVVIRAGETSELDFQIPLGLSITGLVVDREGEPVPDALLEVAPLAMLGFDAQVLATTDEKGRFDVRDAKTECLIGARAEGFTASRMKFFAGKAGNEAEVRLELGPAGGSVDGVVVGPDGTAVADAVVVVGTGSTSGIVAHQDGAPPLPALNYSDAQGRFHAVGIAAGRQPVVARARGFAPFQDQCEIVGGKAIALRIAMSAGATVRGIVTASSGRAVDDAEVNFREWKDFAHQRVFTNAEGQFELIGLPAGEITITSEQDEAGRGSTKIVAVAGEVVSCPIELSRGLELKGRVVDEKHEPIASVFVELDPSQAIRSAFTDADGRFAIANCPETGTLKVSLRGDQIEPLTRVDVDPTKGDVEIAVHRAERNSVRILGRVVAPDGRPVANALIFTTGTHPQTNWSSWPTGADGRFEVGPIAPDTWRVLVRADAFPVFTGEPRELAANATCDLGTITLAAGGWAIFKIEGDRRGALFRLQGDSFGFWSELDETHDEGTLRSRMLVPGDYRLGVFGERIAAQAVPFTIRVGAETQVAIRLQAGTRQRIEVVLPETLPGTLHDVEGITLRAVRDGDLVSAWSLWSPDGKTATENLWLAPGNYTITASLAGHEGHAEFAVTGEEQATVEIALK